VALLVGDSTGACEPGLCPPEAAVREALAAVLDAAPGRIWVAQFASHVERLATVAALAARFGRALALLGRGLREHADVAVRHGYLRLPPGLRVGAATLPARPARQGLGVVTGTQAEPGSALWALARNTHPELRLEPGDTVVRSARTIPGHERRVNRLTDRLWARGVTVVEPDGRHAVHVSGHGHREDLSRLIAWTRPAALLPVHGRVRMLAEHAALARARGVPQVHVPENGAVLRLTDQGLEQTGRVTAGRVRVTGPYVGGVRPAELRERRRLATAGVVVALVRVDPGSTARLGPPQLTARGLLRAEDGEPLLRRAEAALRTALAALPPAARQDPAQVADEVRRELRRFFRRTLGHKPVVIPQVVTPSGTPLAVS
jgi:ribonuclease J